MPKYCFDWYPGASGQLEIYGPSSNQSSRFRYTPPFRATLRPPFEDGLLNTIDDLGPIYEKLDEISHFFSSAQSRKIGDAPKKDVTQEESSILPELETLGSILKY